MKITDVKVWLVQGIKYNWTLLKIYTDEGYTGVGLSLIHISEPTRH